MVRVKVVLQPENLGETMYGYTCPQALVVDEGIPPVDDNPEITVVLREEKNNRKLNIPAILYCYRHILNRVL